MAEAYERRKNARSSSCDFTASRASRCGANCGSIDGELPELLPDRRRGPAAPPRLPRRAPCTRRRTAAAAGRRCRGPGASPPARRLRQAGARRARSRSAGSGGTPRARVFSRSSVARRSRLRDERCQPANAARTASRSPVSPANASSRSRCDAGSSSTWCSCWPWRSTRSAASSRSAALVTSAPLRKARLRPLWAETSRRIDQLGAGRVLEDGFDRRLLLPRPDEIGRGPAADEQPDGADEDRLARAGLAGEDVQARLELELETIDDGQIADGEEAEHRPEVPSYQMFDSAYGACYALPNCAVPAARHSVNRIARASDARRGQRARRRTVSLEGCLLTPLFALAQAAGAPAGSWGRGARPKYRYRQAGCRRHRRREDRSADPADLHRHLLGHHLLQDLGVPPRRATDGDVPRRLPQEQQVLRSAGRLSRRSRRARWSACFSPATRS